MNQYRATLLTCCALFFYMHNLSAAAVSMDDPADTDFDGLPDVTEALLGTDPWLADTDGDGLSDLLEVGDDTARPLDSDQDRRINALDIDDDNDGIPTVIEAKQDSDRDGVPDYLDADSDGDGLPDGDEAGISGFDSDHDGLDDTFDADNDKAEDDNGDGINDHRSLPDGDGDGVPDVRDVTDDGISGDLDGDGLSNGLEQQLGSSAVSADSDGDGVPDALEAGAGPDIPDTDEDGQPDIIDTDDDGDGVPTQQEVPGLPVAPQYLDTDADGVANYLDSDDDGDGVPSAAEDLNRNGDLDDDDSDFDGIADYLDYNDTDGGGDRDNDGLTDRQEMSLGSNPAGTDTDGDGIADELELGFDESAPVDTDKDGIFDFLDQDDDDDGIPTLLEGEQDRDNDGRVNYLDPDPTAYFYCMADGRIVSGVSDFKVLPAENVEILSNAVAADSGRLRWRVSQAGTYTLKFTLPAGMATAGQLDNGLFVTTARAGDGISVLGRGEDISRPGYLADFDPEDLPLWYQQFQIHDPGQIMINLNIPLLGGDCHPE
jgi:heat shock protein beta